MSLAINFFLGIETKMLEDDETENQQRSCEVNYYTHSKKTKKRQRKIQKQIENVDKAKRVQQKKSEQAEPIFPAIQLLNDPQSLAESLLSKAKVAGLSFDVKMHIINFVSRLIGCHKLVILNFYTFMQNYLTSHQKNITQLLVYLIQGTHDVVPPPELLPTLQTIAFNFITDRCSDEVLAIGINSVREIVFRIPGILYEDEMKVLVDDISMYSRKMHKVVVAAAKSFVNLVRLAKILLLTAFL